MHADRERCRLAPAALGQEKDRKARELEEEERQVGTRQGRCPQQPSKQWNSMEAAC